MNSFAIGKDGIKTVMETVIDKMTYDRTVAFMAEMPEISEPGNDEDVTTLDRITWMVRWAYITGYYDALDVYDTAISGGEVDAMKLSQEAEAMTDEEYCKTIRRVSEHFGLDGVKKSPTPRRIPNPSSAPDLPGEDDPAQRMRVEILKILSELFDEEVDDAIRAINAISAGDNEALYQCWKVRLDKSDTIPDDLVDNEFVRRYIAEELPAKNLRREIAERAGNLSVEQLQELIAKIDTQ